LAPEAFTTFAHFGLGADERVELLRRVPDGSMPCCHPLDESLAAAREDIGARLATSRGVA
jgi:hypothetical protein